MIISDMQHKLATWAAEDQTRRFDRLFRLITHPVWLEEAARITLASPGARTPGLDGMRGADLLSQLSDKLELLRTALKEGRYTPSPARRVYIPKANGKMRPLGIPTLFDRIVQRAMLMAMDPIWESDFSRYSHGFRPERSVHHAVRDVRLQLTDCGKWTRGRWIIEGDLASYFDTVHHRKLMSCVRRRVRDKRFEDLLWQFLKAGHIDKGLFRAASDGVPQGGVLSPLLSNITSCSMSSTRGWRGVTSVVKPAKIDGTGTEQSKTGDRLRSTKGGNGNPLSLTADTLMISSSSLKAAKHKRTLSVKSVARS